MKFFIPFVFLSLLLSSCGKYENGPKFSLLSKKARLVNSWKIDRALFNGEPFQLNANAYNNTYIFHNNFDYQILGEANQNQPAEQNGTWKFDENKETVIIEIDGDSDTLKISKLKNKSLWLEWELSSGSIVLYEYVSN